MAMTGGDKLMSKLGDIGQNLSTQAAVKVGFLSRATYPDGTSVAMVAAINEYGGKINRDAGEVTIYRKIDASGAFLHKGRFFKKAVSNFATAHAHGAYTITIPPRPFFRTMIAAKSKEWPGAMAALLMKNNYDVVKTLDQTGTAIEGQLRKSIIDLKTPKNAPSTIRKKGFDDPLIDSGYMLSRVDHEIITGDSK